jgi:hypothetical protein
MCKDSDIKCFADLPADIQHDILAATKKDYESLMQGTTPLTPLDGGGIECNSPPLEISKN